MPDISELNGTAIDNVAEFDGLTVTGVPAPAAAYSVRLLGSGVGVPTYTGPAMRVRRVTGAGNTGNDDEADVAFDTSLATPTISLDSAVSNFSAGGSNATTLGEFLNVGTVPPYNGGLAFSNADSLTGTASCFVDEWKDQSGNANHATQSTPASQPQIHSGTVNTDLISENGKPAIQSNQALSWDTTSDLSIRSLFSVQKSTAGFIMGYSASPPYHSNGSFYLSSFFAASEVINGNNYENSTAKNFTSVARSTSQVLLSMIHTGTVTGNQISRDRSTTNASLVGTRQELIFWSTDQSSNRTGIETNINDYFEIIVNDEAATSGFLFDYPNASAAYSVRQLNNNAKLAMQVERSDGYTKNIGFDGSGNLDTQAIINFAGASTAKIRKWYDQSGAQNHATQITPNDQFEIYDGSSIHTANGKPAALKSGRPPHMEFTALSLSNYCIVWAGRKTLGADVGFMLTDASGSEYIWDRTGISLAHRWDGSSVSTNGSSGTIPYDVLYCLDKNGSSLSDLINGSSDTGTLSGTFNPSQTALSVNSWEGYMNEIIIWDSSQSGSNQTAINNNVNSYFGIY